MKDHDHSSQVRNPQKLEFSFWETMMTHRMKIWSTSINFKGKHLQKHSSFLLQLLTSNYINTFHSLNSIILNKEIQPSSSLRSPQQREALRLGTRHLNSLRRKFDVCNDLLNSSFSRSLRHASFIWSKNNWRRDLATLTQKSPLIIKNMFRGVVSISFIYITWP